MLTSPSSSMYCIPGKRDWIRRHYPQFNKRIIFGSAKQFIAGPAKLLIDDKDSNIVEFEKHGGIGIRVPRLWNSKHNLSNQVIPYLKTGILYHRSMICA